MRCQADCRASEASAATACASGKTASLGEERPIGEGQAAAAIERGFLLLCLGLSMTSSLH